MHLSRFCGVPKHTLTLGWACQGLISDLGFSRFSLGFAILSRIRDQNFANFYFGPVDIWTTFDPFFGVLRFPIEHFDPLGTS